jgi:hypothetical protein
MLHMPDRSHLTLAIVLVLVGAIGGCRKSSNSTSTTGTQPSSAATPQTALNLPEGGVSPAPETKYFKGSIGSSLDLQMKLMRSGEQLNGSYHYQKIGTRINLRGTLDKDGNVTLEEFDNGGKQTGVFKGIWKPDADGLITIAGNWSKPPAEKGGDKKTAFSLHEEPINLGGDADVVTKEIKENNKKLVYEITAQYPQLTGGGNPNFEKFNQTVRGSILKKVSEFKKDMTPDPDREPPPENSMGSNLDVGYTIALAQDDLVSVTLWVSTYFQGAAHPNSYSDIVNYDLKNGKLLKLGDLFKPGAKYVQAISTYCIADLKKQSKQKNGMLDDTSINSGAGPSAKNYQSWTITKKGLGINFNAYQVGSYAAGAQLVIVPYSAIKDLINPDGPIAQFAK